MNLRYTGSAEGGTSRAEGRRAGSMCAVPWQPEIGLGLGAARTRGAPADCRGARVDSAQYGHVAASAFVARRRSTAASCSAKPRTGKSMLKSGSSSGGGPSHFGVCTVQLVEDRSRDSDTRIDPGGRWGSEKRRDPRLTTSAGEERKGRGESGTGGHEVRRGRTDRGGRAWCGNGNEHGGVGLERKWQRVALGCTAPRRQICAAGTRIGLGVSAGQRRRIAPSDRTREGGAGRALARDDASDAALLAREEEGTELLRMLLEEAKELAREDETELDRTVDAAKGEKLLERDADGELLDGTEDERGAEADDAELLREAELLERMEEEPGTELLEREADADDETRELDAEDERGTEDDDAELLERMEEEPGAELLEREVDKLEREVEDSKLERGTEAELRDAEEAELLARDDAGVEISHWEDVEDDERTAELLRTLEITEELARDDTLDTELACEVDAELERGAEDEERSDAELLTREDECETELLCELEETELREDEVTDLLRALEGADDRELDAELARDEEATELLRALLEGADEREVEAELVREDALDAELLVREDDAELLPRDDEGVPELLRTLLDEAKERELAREDVLDTELLARGDDTELLRTLLDEADERELAREEALDAELVAREDDATELLQLLGWAEEELRTLEDERDTEAEEGLRALLALPVKLLRALLERTEEAGDEDWERTRR
ncbi:hypothetical protein B0H15DRAFT_930777 [Mycena belliarum]|uniref:Uncharacterized protein n=1 Tax=Mycena belliarum TaxID=1033014 RepID=A0AAD6XR96_9AGAR|nr:hypothetical protein B0H15DRAFT_930777 [Mycena belliae]